MYPFILFLLPYYIVFILFVVENDPDHQYIKTFVLPTMCVRVSRKGRCWDNSFERCCSHPPTYSLLSIFFFPILRTSNRVIKGKEALGVGSSIMFDSMREEQQYPIHHLWNERVTITIDMHKRILFCCRDPGIAIHMTHVEEDVI